MDQKTFSIVPKVIEVLVAQRAFRATKYLSPKLIVRVTNRKRKFNTRENLELIVTIGRPNSRERDFVKDCLKAKEPFPIKQIIFKLPPVPKQKKGNGKNKK